MIYSLYLLELYIFYTFQVPKVDEEYALGFSISSDADLQLIIKSSGENITGKRSLMVKSKRKDTAPQIIIQTDKSVYKPGQTGNTERQKSGRIIGVKAGKFSKKADVFENSL